MSSQATRRKLRPGADIVALASPGEAFWRRVPAWRDVDAAEFADPLWQERNAVTRVDQLGQLLGPLASAAFMADLAAGLARAPMAMRLTPYVLGLIDWEQPEGDPLRRQFLALGSEMTAPHPLLGLDSLAETSDSPVPGLVHRYPDRALFLATDRCPVYCRFCTRSYSVGDDTSRVGKQRNAPTMERWRAIFEHVRATPAISDIVVSGGDAFRLKASQIAEIGAQLLGIAHVRRIRFATKGLAILPMKITHDAAWTDALCRVAERGRRQGVEVCFHTHFNHPREITGFTEAAAGLLFARGVPLRNQSVLLRGVNDEPAIMAALVKRLSDLHIHPYYVYACDLVEGIEDLRTSLAEACRIEKAVRGVTAGFNTPTFVVDAPGGGGKRIAHSYELYDRAAGLAVFTAPAVKPGEYYVYPDPLRDLAPDVQAAWADAGAARAMIDAVLAEARRLG